MILIALGANLPSSFGSPEETLEAAKAALNREGLRVLKTSRTWLTAPVPVSDQPWYRNAVIAVETALDPQEVLTTLHRVEESFGRVRSVKNAPRAIDLDLLAYNGEVLEQNGLSVPHPRLHQRGFVLYPLQEVAPKWVHPVLKRSVGDLISALSDDQKLKFTSTEAA